jgi:ATP-dependent helicase/nuclease subunit A
MGVVTLTTEGGKGDQRIEEAGRIARYIRAEVDAGRRRFGDFLVLTRMKKPLHVYAQAMEALQIPIEVSGAGAFGDSSEVQQLAALLRALADPQDTVALVGVLRGPLFGLSDRQLFAHRDAGGWLALSSEPAGDDSSPVALALSTLSRWYRWTRIMPAGAALERILEDSGYLALAAATPGGVEAGDLLHAIDRVRDGVEAGFTLAQAADALALFSGLDGDEPDDSSEVESLPLEPGRADVVRLMNLHKAKGLEADVVFLVDPRGGFKPRVDVRIQRGRDGDEPVGYFEIKPDWGFAAKPIASPAGWDRYETEEREYLDAESDRLLYVAATRARDLLVVCRGGKGGTGAWSDLAPHLAGVPELRTPAEVTPPAARVVDLSAGAMATASRDIASAHDRARRPSWAAHAVTAEARRLVFLGAGAGIDAAGDDPTRAVVADTPSRRADAGLAWGSLVHGLLEHAMRHQHVSREDLRRLALWLTLETPDVRAVIDQAIDTVEAVARHAFWQRARASAECHEEAPFSVRDRDGDVAVVVSGIIDLVYRDGEAWRVIDYKTDVAMDDVARARYRQQIDAYARAWRRFGGDVAAELVDVRRPPTGSSSSTDAQ